MDKKALADFVAPYYAGKDIMHDLHHIELVEKMARNIIGMGLYEIDEEVLSLAAAFHGFVYKAEDDIRLWMKQQGYPQSVINRTVLAAWESQRKEKPDTLEGKILHDAHVLEGGRQYTVVKSLVTGSLRGQTLKETLAYLRENVLPQTQCFLPETIPLCEEMNRYTEEFCKELLEAIE